MKTIIEPFRIKVIQVLCQQLFKPALEHEMCFGLLVMDLRPLQAGLQRIEHRHECDRDQRRGDQHLGIGRAHLPQPPHWMVTMPLTPSSVTVRVSLPRLSFTS